MAPKTQPKWINALLEFCDEQSGGNNARSIDKTKRLIGNHYEAFVAHEANVKEQKRRERCEKKGEDPDAPVAGKRKADPVASSIGSALKKLSKASPEEREERLAQIQEQLGERMSNSEDGGNVDLLAAMTKSIAEGTGAADPAETCTGGANCCLHKA